MKLSYDKRKQLTPFTMFSFNTRRTLAFIVVAKIDTRCIILAWIFVIITFLDN